MGELHRTLSSSDVSVNGEAGESTAASYRVHSSRLLRIINWWHMAMVYFPAIQYCLVGLLLCQLLHDVQSHQKQLQVRREPHLNPADQDPPTKRVKYRTLKHLFPAFLGHPR